MDGRNIWMKPEIRVFAGPNGSGKSTFTTSEWIVPPYINADDIQKEQGLSTREAAVLATQMREHAVLEKRSFTFETVMSKERNLILLEKAKEAGFFIKGYYIFTRNPAINIVRVRSRVLSGGHDVPKDKIVSRYWESRSLIPRLYQVCDILHIYDNSSDTSPVRLVRKHKNNTRLFPNEYWSADALYELIGMN